MSSRSHEIVLGLIKSVKAMNEAEFSDQLDVLFELYPVRTVLLDFVSGTMAEIGSQWERGEMMVMMEHFASRQNTPTSDILYAIDNMDVHTLAIGRHIQQKAKKKPQYLVGGLLFSLDKDLVHKIPCAITKSFSDVISLRPETHPGMQDLMVRESVDKTYALLRECAKRLKSSSNALHRRKQFLYDQVSEPTKTAV